MKTPVTGWVWPAIFALVIAPLVAPVAHAAAPAAVLVAPADGSLAEAADVPLAVRANGPDGGSVQVRFEGRRADAAPTPDADPFTVVAIPDVQNYTYSNRQGTIAAQAQWVIDHRAQLNTQMVVQLGDLVSNRANLTQWGHTSDGLRLLDDAGIPNSVVAGNHDFDNVTGAHSEYDQFFPPSRYAGKAWTPATARYGGYLGQNLFGPDPVDTANMNNFVLFSAGGRDFLVLNLEWEAPDYATEWAAKVLRAYPGRIAIMVTHSFIGINGQRRVASQRPGGTAPSQLWTDFVSQQCQIRLVLNGHFSEGDVGEAQRTDPNRCGDPVPQILTNFQSRANGGNGWLRYYTFDLAAGTMSARTYSATLGIFETDADSQFTLPFDLGDAEPAPFETIGTITVPSGEVAKQIWTGLKADSSYEWRVVTSAGGEQTVSDTWTVRTPISDDDGELVVDDFSRTVTDGWGIAPGGLGWQPTGRSSSFSVDGAAGRIEVPTGSTRTARLPGVSVSDVALEADLALASTASGGGSYVTLQGRVSGANSYRAKLRYQANGSVNLGLTRTTTAETTLTSKTLVGLAVVPDQQLRVRFEIEGASPTTLRAKVWARGESEPAHWSVTASDSTPALGQAGAVGIDLYQSSSAAGPAALSVDRYAVARLGDDPAPPNQPPRAVIGTPTVDERKVTVSGVGSTDPDGAIVGYRWEFGDGGTATDSTSSHSYSADGTYLIRLTVTDDDGATDTTTRSVVVESTPPGEPLIAADDFDRSVSSGWGSATVGGSWTAAVADSRYAVGQGNGVHVLSTPGRSAETVLSSVSAANVELRADLAWSRTANQGTIYTSAVVRRQADGSDYRLKVIGTAAGKLQLALIRRLDGVETSLRSVTVAGVGLAADTGYRIAFRVLGSGNSTTLSAKLWQVGTPEPEGWAVTDSDATAALQRAGRIGINTYLSGSATAGITTRVDNLEAEEPR